MIIKNCANKQSIVILRFLSPENQFVLKVEC